MPQTKAWCAERTMRDRRAHLGCTAVLTLAACDAPMASDAGLDVTASPDAGADAPYVPLDAGPPGMALMPLDACDDLVDDLYLTPTGLPAFDPSVRGTLLGCASVETIAAGDLAARLSGVPDLAVTSGDVRMYVIAYRTEREPRGVGGISTALVYLPTVALAERVPLVLLAHGTVGIADGCAPSRFVRDGSGVTGLPESYLDAMLLSFAARGLPVIAPDYAGLGTEGTHGYGNWLDPARSAADGARALRALLPADRLDGGTLVYGHSQGGGIALSVAALEAEAPDLDIRAIVAAGPAYRVATAVSISRITTFALTPLLRYALAMQLRADLANLTADETRWGDALAPAVRDRAAAELDTHCLLDSITGLDTPAAGYVPPPTLGDLFDPDFASAAIACSDTGTCTGLPGAWVMRDVANEPHLSATSPPILVLASELDADATPGLVGCVIDRLRTDEASWEACMVPTGDHLGMVGGTGAYAIEWALAAAAGSVRPPCPGSPTRPRCSLF